MLHPSPLSSTLPYNAFCPYPQIPSAPPTHINTAATAVIAPTNVAVLRTSGAPFDAFISFCWASLRIISCVAVFEHYWVSVKLVSPNSINRCLLLSGVGRSLVSFSPCTPLQVGGCPCLFVEKSHIAVASLDLRRTLHCAEIRRGCSSFLRGLVV